MKFAHQANSPSNTTHRCTANDPDPMVVCKFLTPDAGWTWYVIEFDGVDVFYGYVIGVSQSWERSDCPSFDK